MLLSRRFLHQPRSLLYNPYCKNLNSLDSALINYVHTSFGIAQSTRGIYSTPVLSSQRFRTILDNKYSKSVGHSSCGISYLSPLASLENLDLSSRSTSPLLFSTTSKGGENVLVMDGFSSGSVSGGSVRQTIDSGGSNISSSSLVGYNFFSPEICRLFRTELCLYWEKDRKCPNGRGCMYAHGKDQLRPRKCRRYTTTGKCHHGSNCKVSHGLESAKATVSKAKPITVNRPASVPVQQSSSSSSSSPMSYLSAAMASMKVDNCPNGSGSQDTHPREEPGPVEEPDHSTPVISNPGSHVNHSCEVCAFFMHLRGYF